MQWLQYSLVQVSGLGIEVFSPLYQVFIYETTVLLQLYQFWATIQSKLVYKKSNTANIRIMRIKLLKLQNNDKNVKKFSVERLLEGWKSIEKVLDYQGLSYIPKIIGFELINKYQDNLLAGHFGIEKIWELITWKYYWLIL